MAPLALALVHLTLASADPGAVDLSPAPPVPAPASAERAAELALTLAPPPSERGRLRPGELAMASLGAFAGDALVLGSGYLALQLFADGAISPTATNFRRAVYVFGVSALVVPPLTGVLLAKLTGGGHARGAFWKALVLASLGQGAALAAGYFASPHLWVVLPVQALTISLGTSVGFHWGTPRAGARAGAPQARRERAGPAAGAAALLAVPLCLDAQ